MSRVVTAVWWVGLRTAGLAGAAGILIVLNQAKNQVPAILGAYLPSVHVKKEEASFRKGEKSCFTLTLLKVAPGVPLKPTFQVTTTNGGYSEELPISVYKTKDGTFDRDNTPLPDHPVGSEWPRTYCFDHPGTVTPGDGMHVTGRLVHSRWWGLPVYESVPRFTIPPE